jgi:hypothetical protein
MAEQATSILYYVDVAAKVVAAVAIPVATVFIDFRLKEQTSAIESQKAAFEQSIKTREKDVELLMKFYEIISSDRFKCFDDNTTPLLKIYVDGNNKYSQIQFPFPELASSLARSSLNNTGCKANDDAKLVVSKTGQVPVANSVSAAQVGGAEGGAKAANQLVKSAGSQVQKALAAPPANGAAPSDTTVRPAVVAPLADGSDGWVAVGRYDPEGGFTNFALDGGPKGHVDSRGVLAKGTIIKARWVVYLRASNTDTVLGSNPIVSVVSEGTCAKVLEAFPELRGRTWASVDIQDTCPAGNYK